MLTPHRLVFRTVIYWFATSLSVALGGARASGQCAAQWTAGITSPAPAFSSGSDSTLYSVVTEWDVDGSGPRPPMLVVAGSALTGGAAADRVVAIVDPATGVRTRLATGLNANVLDLVVLRTGELVAAGAFTSISNVSANHVAKFDGQTWSSLGGGTVNTVILLAAMSNGNLAAVEQLPASGPFRIMVWNGVGWTALPASPIPTVSAMVALPGGELLIGGGPSPLLPQAQGNVARWNGTMWSLLGTGFTAAINALAVLPTGEFVAGGGGPRSAAAPVAGVSRWNGQVWTTLGTRLDLVSKLTITGNGELLAGGLFSLSTQPPSQYVARWDGARWNGYGAGPTSRVLSLVSASNGTIVACVNRDNGIIGTLQRFDANPTPPVLTSSPPPLVTTCVDRTVTLSVAATGTPAPGYRWTRSSGEFVAAENGGFGPTLTLANAQRGQSGQYRCAITNNCGTVNSLYTLVTVTLCPCSIADIAGGGATRREPDGTLDGNDFVAFINSFAAGNIAVDALADVAGAGSDGLSPDGLIDATDYVEFFNAFMAGC